MAQKWVAALLAGLLVVTACGSGEPAKSTSAPTLSPLTSSTSKVRVDIDKKEVQDTNCDIPAVTVMQATNSYGEYRAKLEVRRSDLASCVRYYWLRLTPVSLPWGEAGKKFAAVLRVGDSGSDRMVDWAEQKARPSDPRVELITQGRVLESGQQVQGCLVLLDDNGQLANQYFTCTDPYVVP